MELDAWTTENTADTARRKRLTIGYVVGAVTVAVALSFVTYSAHGQVFEPEDTIDVDLAKAPVIAAEEPEPEPQHKPKKVKKKKKRKKRKTAGPPPKDVPDNVPSEADPGDNPYDGDMDELFDGDDGGSRVASVVKVQKPKRKRKKVTANPVAKVSFVSERSKATRAVPVSRRRPAWTRDSVLAAHGAGVTSVVLRCVVKTNGTVGKCNVVQGHPALNAAAIAATRGWRFEPGTFGGKPQAQWYTVPFRIKIRS